MNTLLYEQDEGIGLLTINRPEKMNAISTELTDELAALLDEIEADRDLRVLVITGQGEKAFVAGADIEELVDRDARQGREVTRRRQELFARIENPKGGCGTKGVPLNNGQWVHVAAVKQGGLLSLYVNGAVVQSTSTHPQVHSESAAIGIGFNPRFSGGEHFVGKIDDFAFYARALTEEEIAEQQ